MAAERPGRSLGGLFGGFEQLIRLDDRLDEFRHGNPSILALALQQAESLALAELPSRHQDPFGTLDQFAFTQS
jgi:hypothetical protein